MIETTLPITTQVNPSNYGITTGSGYYADGETVTLTATPNTHRVFVNWTLNGTVVSTNPTYTFTMGTVDQTYVANFALAQTFTVNTSTYPETVGSVHKSTSIVWETESVTLRARDENGYMFDGWSTWQTTNPLTITDVRADINIVAYYKKVSNVNTTIHQYRAYIKDQLNLNTKPKEFIIVNSFDIRRDLLTNTNSTFNTPEKVPESVNEGDIFVLVNPYGTIMYYGVISAINEYSITTNQIQSFYAGNWVYDVYPTTSLEAEVAHLLNQYAQGYQKGSTYQDILMNQEKSPIAVKTGSTTTGKLETQDANSTMDFEDFIYSLYDSYNLVFDFNIPFGSWQPGQTNEGSVTIRNPASSVIKVSNNAECVIDMLPTTEVTDVNKLIVYGSDGTYRTTYIATTDEIKTEPTSVVGRINSIKTSIIFSDDDLDAIKAANINLDQFNHKVEFTLLLKNNLYNFWDWELGQTLQIYKDDKYFDSVFTAYEIKKEENKEPTEVKITAGKVRNKLTTLLKMGIAK